MSLNPTKAVVVALDTKTQNVVNSVNGERLDQVFVFQELIRGLGKKVDENVTLRRRHPNTVEIQRENGRNNLQRSFTFFSPVPGSLVRVLLFAFASSWSALPIVNISNQ